MYYRTHGCRQGLLRQNKSAEYIMPLLIVNTVTVRIKNDPWCVLDKLPPTDQMAYKTDFDQMRFFVRQVMPIRKSHMILGRGPMGAPIGGRKNLIASVSTLRPNETF